MEGTGGVSAQDYAPIVAILRARYRGRIESAAKELRRVADACDAGRLYGSEGGNLARQCAEIDASTEALSVLRELFGAEKP